MNYYSDDINDYHSFFDKQGRAYTYMLGQFTECDTEDEIKKYLKEIGFQNISIHKIYGSALLLILRKF